MPLTFNSETIGASNPTFRNSTKFTDVIDQGSTFSYSVQLLDSAGGSIADTDFSAITATLVDETTGAVINDRQDQDILNDNNFTLSATALLAWNGQAGDSVFVDPTQTRKLEWHRLVITFTFDVGGGTEVGIHEVRYPVQKNFVSFLQDNIA